MNWNVKASPHFWRTALPLKEKYTHEQFASIIRSIREAICELAARGARGGERMARPPARA